jgi:threonine/homoserine/homoserine lactone efflux protein
MSQDLAAIGPLLLFAAIATITPGGATTLATISGANFGFRRSLPVIFGCASGLASIAALAALGVASLLAAAPSLALLMRAFGSAYLLWLAWQTARRGPPRLASTAKPTRFLAGLVMLWYNPKGWAMTLGAAASFSIDPAAPLRRSVTLAAIFGLTALLSLLLWCATGLLLARAMRSDTHWRVLNRTLGALLAVSIAPVWL